ncbi:alcohol dehydrogenase catalytic domain-containing protein [Streptomyces sp. NPDC008150]|uniref:NADP-dependent oxidoreductase n=1 Tax=Streptomyces sp. NPDC008150 TaxID=3364816 RepID=UPI0036E90B53
MRAVRFHHYGDVDVLDVEDVEPRALGPQEVRVEVRAAGINPGEAKIRTGALHAFLPATFPSGQGSDLAGTVVETGTDVTRWQPGDHVLGWSWERSSHAEYVAVPEGQLVAKPADLSWQVAGALYVSGCTAHAAVAAVAPGPGETVVITAASGGVGSIAVQLVRRTGARPVAVASPRHQEWLEARGATFVSYGEGVEGRIEEAVGGTAPEAFLDFYGGDYVRLALDLGVAPARINTIDYAAAEAHGTRSDASTEGTRPEVLAELALLAATGAIEVPVSAVHPLEDVRQAFQQLEHGHPLGKIVLAP